MHICIEYDEEEEEEEEEDYETKKASRAHPQI